MWSGGVGLGLGEDFRAGQSSCGVVLGDARQFPKEDLACALWVLRAPEASAVRRMCGGASPDHHGHLARVKMVLLASTCCVAGRSGKNKEVAEMAKKVTKKLKRNLGKKA